jgi:aspartate racemase
VKAALLCCSLKCGGIIRIYELKAVKAVISRMSNYKKLGVIGGVGPAATALFFQRVVEFTNAATDQEHLDIDILNRPQIPNRTDYLLHKQDAPSFVPYMRATAQQLETFGCEVLATPCNTAHAELSSIAASLTNARFVNMLEETAAFVQSLGVARCGVLATDGTIATRIYEHALAKFNIECVIPSKEDQAYVMNLIYEQVKAGNIPPKEALSVQCDRMFDASCDAVILGCTELSVIPYDRIMPRGFVVDALDVLAWRCVQECGAPAKDLHDLFAKN